MNPNAIWEYKILALETLGEWEKRMPEWQAMLTAAGNEGWELVAVDMKEGIAVFAYFKRQIGVVPQNV